MMIIVLAIIVLLILLFYRDFVLRITREKHERHILKVQYQNDILEQCIKVQEDERERIAVTLHDDVGSKLNILSVWISNPDNWNNNRFKEIIEKQIPRLIESTRGISHTLYPVNLDRFGLILTIEEMIANVEAFLEIKFVLLHQYTPRDVSLEVQLYRVVQEFLSNVLKHSGANKMLIYIRDSDKLLSIKLADNGKGFDIKGKNNGMGLRNIDLRLSSLGAAYKWKSKVNEGCCLTIVIPKL